MTAFDAAMRTMLSDPNFTREITYTPSNGMPVTIARARLSALPEIMQGAAVPYHAGTSYQLIILAEDLPDAAQPSIDDRVTDGTTTWRVHDLPEKRHGAWHLPLMVEQA